MSTKQTPNEVEEVKDLEQVEEVQDLEEAPEEIKEPVEEVKAPVLRGGLRGAADPDMIQKHIDNFLAMLCGETPVDSNVRTSAEYWLKRLATGEGEGSTKKIYWHTVLVRRTGSNYALRAYIIVLNNSSASFTKDDFIEMIETPGVKFVAINGYQYIDSTSTWAHITTIEYASNGKYLYNYYEMPISSLDGVNNLSQSVPQTFDDLVITDLGVNPIN